MEDHPKPQYSHPHNQALHTTVQERYRRVDRRGRPIARLRRGGRRRPRHPVCASRMIGNCPPVWIWLCCVRLSEKGAFMSLCDAAETVKTLQILTTLFVNTQLF